MVSFKFNNDATYSYARLDPSLAREIAATVVPASADRFFKDEAMLTLLRSRHDKINARTAALAPPPPPPRPVDARTARSPIETLPGRTRKHLQPSLGIDEEVRAVIKGYSKQALAVLDDRLIIVKPGLQAGAGFGAKVTSFPYHQIQGINLRTAMLSTGIEVLSSAYPRSVTDVGDGKKVRKALYEQPNCLPLTSADAHVQEVVRQISGRAGR